MSTTRGNSEKLHPEPGSTVSEPPLLDLRSETASDGFGCPSEAVPRGPFQQELTGATEPPPQGRPVSTASRRLGQRRLHDLGGFDTLPVDRDAPPTRSGDAPKILVVTEDAELQASVVDVLRYVGFAVQATADASTALNRLRTERFDLLLCDADLPGNACRSFRKAFGTETGLTTPPALFLTAQSRDESERTALGITEEDCIRKPVGRRELLWAVETRLRGTRGPKQPRTPAGQQDDPEYRMACCISRDMRTPLAGILGWAEVLDLDSSADLLPQLKNIGGDLRVCGERLLSLAERLPVLFQVQQLSQSRESQPGSKAGQAAFVSEAVSATLEDQATRGRSAEGVRVNVSEGCVHMQPDMFRAVVREVVDNALKFSRSGDPITITSTFEDGHYQIRFTDSGRGMSESQALARSSSDAPGGERWDENDGGLGLALVRRLCTLHSGCVRVESCERVGTRVVVSIPGVLCRDCSNANECKHRPERSVGTIMPTDPVV